MNRKAAQAGHGDRAARARTSTSGPPNFLDAGQHRIEAGEVGAGFAAGDDPGQCGFAHFRAARQDQIGPTGSAAIGAGAATACRGRGLRSWPRKLLDCAWSHPIGQGRDRLQSGRCASNAKQIVTTGLVRWIAARSGRWVTNPASRYLRRTDRARVKQNCPNFSPNRVIHSLVPFLGKQRCPGSRAVWRSAAAPVAAGGGVMGPPAPQKGGGFGGGGEGGVSTQPVALGRFSQTDVDTIKHP